MAIRTQASAQQQGEIPQDSPTQMGQGPKTTPSLRRSEDDTPPRKATQHQIITDWASI